MRPRYSLPFPGGLLLKWKLTLAVPAEDVNRKDENCFIASWHECQLAQPFVFRPAAHDIHVFDRLARGAFDEIVERGDDDEPLGARIVAQTDRAVVRAANGFGLRQLAGWQQADKRFAAIKFFVEL